MKTFLIAVAISVGALSASAQPLPDHRTVVEGVYATGKFNISTHEGQAAFTDEVICQLNRVDSRWGNLRKNPGQTNIHGHAEDSALFVRIGAGASQSVDFISGAGAPGARPGWNPDTPRYSESDWTPPHNCGSAPDNPGPSPNPTPTPQPVPPLDTDTIMELMAGLERSLAQLSVQLSSVAEAVTSLGNRVETVLQTNDRITRQLLEPVLYRGSVLGMPVTLRPTINPVKE